MNVGIMTIHNHFNYGAALQAFALNYAVRKLGHNCQTIDCEMEPEVGRKFKWKTNPGARLTGFYNLFKSSANRRHKEKFKKFIHDRIPTSQKKFYSLDELKISYPPCDAYITGSDQVWRPSLLDRPIGDAFHLGFASPDKYKLISYAPSFGVSEIPERYHDKIRKYLKRYQHVSVREKRGQEIIYDLCGITAEHVLDPTLLLTVDEYSDVISSDVIEEKYILVYPMELGNNMEFINLVRLIKKMTSLKVICVMPINYNFRWLTVANRIILDAGPEEFLNLVKNASFVCTNSFHGTIYSILFNKQFVGTPHSVSNARSYSLLESIGLLSRQLKDNINNNVENVLQDNIDYNTVSSKIQKLRLNSLKFLKNSLHE